MKIFCVIFALILQFLEVFSGSVTNSYTGECRHVSNLPIRFVNLEKHEYSKNNRTLSVDMVIPKKITKLGIAIDILRCKSLDNLNSCEYFMRNKKMENICSMLSSKNQIWSSVNFEPKMSCPVEPNSYHSEFPCTWPAPGIWHLRFYLLDNGEVAGCFESVMKVSPK